MVDFKKKSAGKKTKLAGKSLNGYDLPTENPLLDNYTEGRLYKIPLSSISPDPDQPRKHFDKEKLTELGDSIKSKGVLQPIILRINDKTSIDAEFLIIAGERRFRGCRLAGVEQIPAIFTSGDPEEIALIENLQREDLKPIEEAEGYKRIMDSHNYTHEQLSVVVGKARTTITELLTLNKLPDDIKEDCRMFDISKIALLEIAKRKDQNEAKFLYNKVKKENFTVAKIKQLTRPKKERKKSLVEERVLQKIIETQKLISKINKESIGKEDRMKIWDEFNALTRLMQKLFNQ